MAYIAIQVKYWININIIIITIVVIVIIIVIITITIMTIMSNRLRRGWSTFRPTTMCTGT